MRRDHLFRPVLCVCVCLDVCLDVCVCFCDWPRVFVFVCYSIIIYTSKKVPMVALLFLAHREEYTCTVGCFVIGQIFFCLLSFYRVYHAKCIFVTYFIFQNLGPCVCVCTCVCTFGVHLPIGYFCLCFFLVGPLFFFFVVVVVGSTLFLF